MCQVTLYYFQKVHFKGILRSILTGIYVKYYKYPPNCNYFSTKDKQCKVCPQIIFVIHDLIVLLGAIAALNTLLASPYSTEKTTMQNLQQQAQYTHTHSHMHILFRMPYMNTLTVLSSPETW